MPLVNDVSLVIPAINSEKKIGYLLTYAKAFFEEIVVGIDTRTTDATLQVCEKHGVRTVEVTNDTYYAEHSIDQLFSQATKPWIFRIDDDELFSPEMADFLMKIGDYGDITTIGVHRKWCRFNRQRQLQWTVFPPIGFDWQFRLAQIDKITYVDRVHTPGIKIENVAFAPMDSYIVHLDYLYTTLQQRMEKVNNYERTEPGMGKGTAFYYLWEQIPDAEQFFVDLENQVLQEIVETIAMEAGL